MSLYHRRQTSLRQYQIIGVLAVIVYVLVQFVTFQLSLGRVPATWTIGDHAYPEAAIEVAVAQVQLDLQQTPLQLIYRADSIELAPDTIGFSVDVTETVRLVREARYQSSALTDFLRHLFFQQPAPRAVPVVIDYSDEQLRARLAEIAARLDRPVQASEPITATMTLQAGQPGYQLNIVASIGPIEAALKSAAQRDVDLIVDDQPAPPLALDQLGRLMQARLAAFNGSAGIFVKDLRTGEELDLNPDVAYSGVGVMKLPLLIEAYRRYDEPWPPALTAVVSAALRTEAANAPANDWLAFLGNGDALVAVQDVSASMQALGLRSTFMRQAFDQPLSPTLTIATPANTHPAAKTNADPSIQTTPAEIGVLLEMIYQCRGGGGALL
ncbi:MAG TPA: peptidoglycan binding domain-containing protein, partial [Anaerolineae bacterium]|nr:peptidoglycan binding domain-containing protein [Anaerolineae bacterium]